MRPVQKVAETPVLSTTRLTIPTRTASVTSTNDPEAVADQFAEANYATNPDGSSDIYVDQATWEMLYGTSFSEDISGDGSVVATVLVDPISSVNPSGSIHLLLNGVEVARINPRYTPTNGGWYSQDQESSAYSYYTAQQTTSGSVYYEHPPELETGRDPNRLQQLRLSLPRYAVQLGVYLGEAVLPKSAHAQTCHECAPYGGGPGGPNPCQFEQRGILLGIIGMLYNAHKANVVSFLFGATGTVNFLHAYGRCAARNPQYTQ